MVPESGKGPAWKVGAGTKSRGGSIPSHSVMTVWAVIGSRTFPVTQDEFAKLSKGRAIGTLIRGELIVKKHTLKRLEPGDKVVSGAAAGPDTWGVNAAKAVGHPIEEIPADWDRLGRKAGFARNTTIAEKADKVLAFWDGKSRGTRDTIIKAHEMGKVVIVVYGDERVKSNESVLPPPDHAEFERIRNLGLVGVRRDLERRRKKPLDTDQLDVLVEKIRRA